jgi:hypothetical protein
MRKHLAISKSIHKLWILPIRQIQPLLVLQLDVLRVRAQHDFLRVLPLAVPVDEQHVEQAHAPARDDGDLGGDVARRVAGAEGLGADDVADAVWRIELVRFFVDGGWGNTYQYPIRYKAATVVFLVYPATLLLINDKNATNGVGEA